jgi:hypothetical protein
MISYKAVQAGSRGFMFICVCPVLVFPDACSSSLSVVLCIIVGEAADTLRQREICAGGWQSEVLCPHILWQVQVFPDACRSLLFSVLCFSFTDPGGEELREREKERKKATN